MHLKPSGRGWEGSLEEPGPLQARLQKPMEPAEFQSGEDSVEA